MIGSEDDEPKARGPLCPGLQKASAIGPRPPPVVVVVVELLETISKLRLAHGDKRAMSSDRSTSRARGRPPVGGVGVQASGISSLWHL